jgi:uncharacterized membrane protein (UPF0127 family)
MRRFIAPVFCALVLLGTLIAVPVGGPTWAQQENARPDFATGTLSIQTAEGSPREFRIELARTVAERAFGLMFVREMADDRGMLFDYGRDKHVSMWMKNTYVPLDMLFIESDGRIESIIERAAPHSRDPRASKGRVMAVLELKGGITSRLGIKAGDRVIHPIFD